MKINHHETGTVYEIIPHKGGFRLTDSSTKRSHSFKESYEALWCAIELIRDSSFDKLNQDDMAEVSKYSQVALSSIPKSLISMLRREKINRTYYDQIFMKLLSVYRSGNDFFEISNKTNFIVHHEIAWLLRNYMGIKSSFSSIKA